MTLTPAGKIRIMVAQNMANPLAEGYTEGVSNDKPMTDKTITDKPVTDQSLGDTPVGDTPMENSNDDIPIIPDEPMGEESMSEPTTDGKTTLTDYVYSKLQHYGYPGRRLEEFKKKFVNQDISPDGTETVKIEIPDKKYPDQMTGKAETIETEELGQLAREVTKTFGLNFNGAHRSEGRWTIDFTSSKVESDQDREGNAVHDNLDEVYGTPSGGGKKSKGRPVKASLIKNLIKKEKDKIIGKLKQIIGDKYAS